MTTPRGLLTPEQKDKLKQALAAGSRLGASDMRLVNVDVYRERLGKEWPKYRNIIHAYAAMAIKSQLTENDFFVQTTDGYGIFFFTKTADEIQQASQRIAAELASQFSRDSVLGDPPLSCRATSVNCDEFLHMLEAEEAGQPPAKEAGAAPARVDGGSKSAQSVAPNYAPFWHAKLERIVGSVCSTARSQRPFIEQGYYEPTPDRVQEDLRVFDRVLSDAYKLHKAGQSAAIVFSINFKSFCTPEFKKNYLTALRQAPASLVKYLTPQFVRIPPGTPQSLLVDKVQLLTTIFKNVILHTRPDRDLNSFHFVPCSILAASWRDVAALQHQTSRASGIGSLRGFCQSVKDLRLNSLIDGVDTQEAFEAALISGADFVSGSAVAPISHALQSQRARTLADIRNTAFPPAPNSERPRAPARQQADVDFM